MKPSKPCKRCGKHPRLKGMFYCAECKAEIARITREKKRAYMRVYTAAKKAAKEAAQAAAIAEAAKEAAKTVAIAEAAEVVAAELTPPQPGQWTTTSITTVTTNGENPPTVHTETKTEPVAEVKMCTKCGKHPALGDRSICHDCLLEAKKVYNKRYNARIKKLKPTTTELCVDCGKAPRLYGNSRCRECLLRRKRILERERVARIKANAAKGVFIGAAAKPCSLCGKNPRVPGRSWCSTCNALTQRKGWRKSAKKVDKAAPIVVQQNNAQNNNVQKFVQPDLPFDAPQQTPIVVQQNNVQNNAPMHDLETVVPKEQVLNVNVTNPIKVDVQHTNEHHQHWWVGYIVAAAFFLMWLGTMVKNWFK